jgi:porin
MPYRRQTMRRPLRYARLAASLFAIIAMVAAAPAAAEEETAPTKPVSIHAAYTADVVTTLSGGSDRKFRYLDNLDVTLDADLERLIGWNGATLHAALLNNLGAVPNDPVGTLQGVDNIEVASQRLRLFEFWLEQALGKSGSLRAGLYDLNAEFYANDSAGLLIAPSFGIGSELAATGPNGPSIFPSTSLSARARFEIGARGYVQAAAINAKAGVLGDPHGIDFSFDHGILGIAEAGYQHQGKIAAGLWRYSKKQDDIRLVDAAGDPVRQTSQGAYALFEYPLLDAEQKPSLTLFARVGASEGRTTAFKSGWQAGGLVTRLLGGREDSQLSFGIARGFVSKRFRANQADLGIQATKTETQFELTYSDKIGRYVTVQPDIQYIVHPGAEAARKDALVFAMRVGVGF